MGSWPGAEADRWWASLPPSRREQIHRWIDPVVEEPVPQHQLALDVTSVETGRKGSADPRVRA